MADGYEDDPRSGTVVAVGPGFTKDNGEFCPVRVSVGDRVTFHPACGEKTQFASGKDRFRFIRDLDVTALVRT